MIDDQTVHHHEHDDCRSQVVEVGAQTETAQSKHRDDDPSVAASAELRDEVEASVVCQDVHNCHCCQQIHHNAGQLGNVCGEYILPDELVYCPDAIVLVSKKLLEPCVVKRLDVVGTNADIQNPAPYTAEERHGGFVDAGNVFGTDEQVSEQHQGNNSNSHGR